MPELPDVENYKRYLDAHALREPIAGVTVRSATVLRDVSAADLRRRLQGRRFERSRRYGKHLLVGLDDGAWLTLHFGMTGRLAYFREPADDPPYDRVRFDFENGHHLAYEDRRQLGGVGLADDADAFVAGLGLGPDALDPALDLAAFRRLLSRRGGRVKTALMDQALVAGIGNIYADEILFQAGLHPESPLGALSDEQVAALYRTMRRVLTTAVARGAGAEELTDRLPRGWLLPHRKAGAACPRCGGPIETLKAGGRTSYLCPRCQPPAT